MKYEANNFINRDGTLTNDFPPLDSTTNFDLTSPNNQLYKFNSVHGVSSFQGEHPSLDTI